MTVKVPLNRLRLSTKNVRKKAPSAAYISLLAASILKDGLLQNLVVESTDTDALDVTAGGCRLMAMELLHNDGSIPSDYAVDVTIREPGSPSVSLKENYLRAPMHPVDEYEAFAELHKADSYPVKQIATDFGVSIKHVKQRLRLAGVHPALRNLCRDGAFDLDVLMSFAVSEDHEKQWKIWEGFKGNRHVNSYVVRQAMTAGAIDKDHRWAKLIGVAAYKKAGGVISTDLFEDNTFFEQPEVLRGLVQQRLDAVKADFAGWKWVRADLELDRNFENSCTEIEKQDTAKSRKLQEKADEVEAEIEKLNAIDDPDEETEQRLDALNSELDELETKVDAAKSIPKNAKEAAGVYIHINHRGEIVTRCALIHPDDAKAARPNQVAHAQQNGNTDPIESEGSANYSRALVEDCWAYRLAAVKVAHAQQASFTMLFDIFLCELIQRNVLAYREPALSISAQNTFKETSRSDLKNSTLRGILDGAQQAALDALPEDASFSELYEAVSALNSEEKHRIFATLIAKAITYPSANGGQLPFLESLLGSDLRAEWCPTAENLFSRVPAKELIAWGPEVFVDAWEGRGYEKLTKKELVKLFDDFFNVEKEGAGSDAQQHVRAHWLPPFMRGEAHVSRTEEAAEA